MSDTKKSNKDPMKSITIRINKSSQMYTRLRDTLSSESNDAKTWAAVVQRELEMAHLGNAEIGRFKALLEAEKIRNAEWKGLVEAERDRHAEARGSEKAKLKELEEWKQAGVVRDALMKAQIEELETQIAMLELERDNWKRATLSIATALADFTNR